MSRHMIESMSQISVFRCGSSRCGWPHNAQVLSIWRHSDYGLTHGSDWIAYVEIRLDSVGTHSKLISKYLTSVGVLCQSQDLQLTNDHSFSCVCGF